MKHKIRSFIEKYQLIDRHEPVLVGLSGGADSVALLLVLHQLGYTCMAAHCNFHLRGEESEQDANFSRELAFRLQVPFYTIDFDTHGYAEQNHLSIEMAARELRYEWFEKIRVENKAGTIAVAHHRDDSVETLLLNLVRGTGIRGLSGIAPRNGNIIRPLLAVTREEILQWLDKQQEEYMTDSTNLSDVYTRNFIRLQVVPLLEKLNPAVKESVFRTSEHLREVETIYLHQIEIAKKELIEDSRITISKLLAYPSPATILYELLKTYNFPRQVASDIFHALQGEPGKLFFSPTHRLVKDRDQLIWEPLSEDNNREYAVYPENQPDTLPVKLSVGQIVIKEDFIVAKDKDIACFDAGKLIFPLILRKWKKEDWFIPFGMTGRKKLSDYFSDRKLSRFKKEEIWVLCNGKDIIWILGERTDNRYK
ncbi:MAG: tRNA lysidine(34) synthetase TilS, partial [Tannerellaceae bacterium]|nr:tRNA lysidine(34) synthetase TilS [Tannerellaceae bacterium]